MRKVSHAAPSAKELLSRPGRPVLVEEHAREGSPDTIAWLCGLAPWCEHRRVATEDAPRVVVSADGVPPITFVGAVEGRLLEAFVVLLAELSTDDPHFDTPATPARLGELSSSHDLVAVVTPTCPACPSVLAAVLRFAQAKAPLRVNVVRPEWLEGRRVTSTPSVLADGVLVSSGAIGEYALADRLVTALSPLRSSSARPR